ncbi:uncharacterized protein LOC126753150 [Bactrocera neohumeralis]|uniref:uncharacterized protein LOC120768375 n=1 Tax=Bactrocera tryoni TaxID=59916 RepID=UPI001A975D96|nr:uncharacterized protein LOC120768375 [Bactrocera tryoni]XP_050320310.1 uncharacterized protein LOC126753150 [Bactrocera neohumeralis]
MDVISEINEKYSALEAEVDRRLEKIKVDENKLQKLEEQRAKKTPAQANKTLSYEECIERNTNLLKSLDIAKARLRSRSTFSPVEQILEKAIANYKRELATSRQQLTSRLEQVQIHEASSGPEPTRADEG